MKIVIQESGNFLKAEKVNVGDIATILNEGKIREVKFKDEEPRQALEIEVEIKGEKYLWTMSKTAVKTIVQEIGDDTKKWIGRQVRLGKVKMNVRGVVRDVIAVMEVIKEEKKVETEKASVKL
jgi:hypothetical protein